MDHKKTKSILYFVKGMHCASCEILIEKGLLILPSIKQVDASAANGQVQVQYDDEKLLINEINEKFRKEGYVFSESPFKKEKAQEKFSATFVVVPLIIVGIFYFLQKTGLSTLINVNSKSSIISFFGFGLLAGISSCAALVGGIVLSMSKQWSALYSQTQSFAKKLQPHLMFNVGRIISFALLGGVLGLIGAKLQLSLKFGSWLVIIISTLMFFLALQMLGVKWFSGFQLALPKSATKYIANEEKFKGKYMPFIMGALTFFLPCGFTITTQGLALVSGGFLQGALITSAFVLGTTPALFFIGLSSVKFSQKPHLAYQFSKAAGILVLFFAVYNVNAQMNVLGLPSLNDLKSGTAQTIKTSINDLPEKVNGIQVIKMDASSQGFSPNYFKVQVGIPVRWEVANKGVSGCTNAVISQALFAGQIDLKIPIGQVAIKEFTPQKTGKYKFSCWMGMVSGIIEVVTGSDAKGVSPDTNTVQAGDGTGITPSGATGCCGGSVK